jgi:hypothetical protein
LGLRSLVPASPSERSFYFKVPDNEKLTLSGTYLSLFHKFLCHVFKVVIQLLALLFYCEERLKPGEKCGIVVQPEMFGLENHISYR